MSVIAGEGENLAAPTDVGYTIEQGEGRGRCLIASKDFAAGEIVIEEVKEPCFNIIKAF